MGLLDYPNVALAGILSKNSTIAPHAAMEAPAFASLPVQTSQGFETGFPHQDVAEEEAALARCSAVRFEA